MPFYNAVFFTEEKLDTDFSLHHSFERGNSRPDSESIKGGRVSGSRDGEIIAQSYIQGCWLQALNTIFSSFNVMTFYIKAQNNADGMLEGSRTFQSMMSGAVVFFFKLSFYPFWRYFASVAALQNLLEGTAEGG